MSVGVAPGKPTIERWSYAATIQDFLTDGHEQIVGTLAKNHAFHSLTDTQRAAWQETIRILRIALKEIPDGLLLLEYSVPRLGRRIDAVVILPNAVCVLEFKTGAQEVTRSALDQAWDYALDLKYFHEHSRDCLIVPAVVISGTTGEESLDKAFRLSIGCDQVAEPTACYETQLASFLRQASELPAPSPLATDWVNGRYSPSPSIIEATVALFKGHRVEEISRSDTGAEGLRQTIEAVDGVIEAARQNGEKVVCFVTGVPGAGKTLVGLTVATRWSRPEESVSAAFLSGNGPLVEVLQAAISRDRLSRVSNTDRRVQRRETGRQVHSLIQNVHKFRDDCLSTATPPNERIAIFDEAQRAWNLEQTSKFMRRKRGIEFQQSEPEFLLQCINRHDGWGVVICLIGEQQEIHDGEGGTSEWLSALTRFPHWRAVLPSVLSERMPGLACITTTYDDRFHLTVNLRSFRAESLSRFVDSLLESHAERARQFLAELEKRFEVEVTRDLNRARDWLRGKARGTERIGLLASSRARRLRPHSIDVRSEIEPCNWFLNGKDDVRSSYYLEEVATEFQCQGLELDWACVAWDADLRRGSNGWEYHSFKGTRWQRERTEVRTRHIRNAYRVLLTRARQGVIIFVPNGDSRDATRPCEVYDQIFHYLRSLGVAELT